MGQGEDSACGFYASNFRDSPTPIVSRNAIKIGKIAHPYEIVSVDPGILHGGAKFRWFGTFGAGGDIGKSRAPLFRHLAMQALDFATRDDAMVIQR